MIERDIRAALDSAGYRARPHRDRFVPGLDHRLDHAPRAARKLHAYGIAPPTGAVDCPQCGSADTEEISRFGSTPCKALWRCRACAEPFDLFKCH